MRNYIGTVKKADISDYLFYSNKMGAISDLIATLQNLAIPPHFTDGISLDSLIQQAMDLKEKKQAIFMEIFKKYDWGKQYLPQQVFIYDSGKVYAVPNTEDIADIEERILKNKRSLV